MRHRLEYYARALDFWHRASKMQLSRCLDSDGSDWRQQRADIAFYAVCVQRIREVARMAANKEHVAGAREALQRFDGAWPRFVELRNQDEHITLGHAPTAHPGITYFPSSVCDLLSDGNVDYLLHLKSTPDDVEVLVAALGAALPALQDDGI